MNLLNFITQFPDEESFKLKFKEIRDIVGVFCSKCKGTEHYWKKDKWQYECKKCKTRVTLRRGTAMQSSKLPLRYRFVAIHLLTSTKKSFSALEVQRQLGHNRYEPVWAMLHKLREVMGQTDGKYELSGEIELDDGFFSTETIEEEKDKPLKRGRGSQKKTKVLILAESKEIEGETSKNGKTRKVSYIKMKVLEDLKAETITPIVNANVSEKSILLTDNSNSYTDLKEIVLEHKAQIIPKEKIEEMLPWVHIAISNAKRMLLDIHHDIKPEFLQNYLNEYCYKFNRRYYGEALFDRLLKACVTNEN